MAKRRFEPEEENKNALVVDHGTATEIAILTSMMVDRETRAYVFSKGVRPDTFITPQYAAAAGALLELERRKLDFDPAMVSRLYGDRVDVEHLVKLCEIRPDPLDRPDLDAYIDGMLWDRQRVVAAANVVGPFLAALKNPAEEPARVRALAAHVHEAFRGSHGAGRYLIDPKVLVESAAAKIRARLRGEAIYPFGVDGLDDYEEGAVDQQTREDLSGQPRVIPGAKPGHITVITGYTGSGKTTLAFNMALGLARRERRVLYCAWEPEAEETIENLACVSLKMGRTRLLAGDRAVPPLREEEVIAHHERMAAIAPHVRFFSNPFRLRASQGRLSNDRNLDIAQEHIAASGCDVVIFDLWERALVDLEQAAITAALWRTQAMAEELGFHAILLAQQLIKGGKPREDRRPTLEGIKYSASFAEVAHLVLGTHREGVFKPGVGDTTIEIHALKARGMKRGVAVECDFDGDRGIIANGRTIAPMDLIVEGGMGVAEDFLLPGQLQKRGSKRTRFE